MTRDLDHQLAGDRGRAAHLAGEHDAVGRRQGLDAAPRLRFGGKKGVDNRVRDAVANLVGMPFRHRLAGENKIVLRQRTVSLNLGASGQRIRPADDRVGPLSSVLLSNRSRKASSPILPSAAFRRVGGELLGGSPRLRRRAPSRDRAGAGEPPHPRSRNRLGPVRPSRAGAAGRIRRLRPAARQSRPIAGARTGSVSSKKNDTGTSSTRLSSCSRLAPIRLAPRSYFCTCWKVSPIASPSFSWLRPSMLRRSRSRAPTRTSIGFGVSIFGRPGRRGGCDRAIFESQ